MQAQADKHVRLIDGLVYAKQPWFDNLVTINNLVAIVHPGHCFGQNHQKMTNSSKVTAQTTTTMLSVTGHLKYTSYWFPKWRNLKTWNRTTSTVSSEFLSASEYSSANHLIINLQQNSCLSGIFACSHSLLKNVSFIINTRDKLFKNSY